MSQSDVKFITRFIPPDHISSITFSDADTKRLDEIHLFLSTFDIRRFNGLKSLSFGQTNAQSRQQLTILSKIIDQHNLFPLRLSNLDYLVEHIFRPVQHVLKYIAIRICTYYQYRNILHSLPNLQTFQIEYCDNNDNDETVRSSATDRTYHQLKSLIIYNCQLPIEYLRLFLLLTPALVNLKLISPRKVYGPVFDGSFWEQFIQIRLTKLNKFEFFFVYPIQRNLPVHSVDSIIATFRTPFWINDKHWFATCDHVVKTSQIILYTKPICMNDCEILVRCETLPMNSVCRLIKHRTNESGDIIATENLTVLDLTGYPIGEQGAQDLADVLLNDVTLNTLNLQETHIGDSGLEQLTYALQNNTTLTTLHIGNNEIGTVGTQYLAVALRNNLTLLALHLPLNQIMNEALHYLTNGLQYNT
ncbi:unnamed protein product, partial [Adineta steineri]